MIKQRSGRVDVLPYKKAASTVFAANDVVTRDSSGNLVRATSATPRARLLGLIDRAVAATDSDYASNTLVNVSKLAGDDKEFTMDVGTGSLVQSMVGKQFDLKDENEVDVTSNEIGHVEVVRVISTTQGVFRFVTDGKTNLVQKSFTQTIALADFTDGSGAAGTKALNCTIPAGCVFVQSLATELTGFAGDTSAVIIVGDGSDTDRYSTGTPSVFTTAAAGADLGVPSGTKFHSADKTPTVTITAGSDWGAVTGGQVTITLVWLEAALV